MTRTPSYLKGLAENRARLAGDIKRYERGMAEYAALLDKVRAEMAACDLLIRKFDERLNPDLIEPMHGHERYGKRGEFRKVLLRCVEKAYPDEITTPEIAAMLQVTFDMEFPSPQAREDWIANSVRTALKKFVKQGVIERLHEASKAAAVGRWRFVDKTGTAAL